MGVVLGMVINTPADADTQPIASFSYEKLLDCGLSIILNNLLSGITQLSINEASI